MGTPYRGAASSLLQLVNGVRKGIGPLRLDLTAFARSCPSTHQLLPGYHSVGTGEDLRHHRKLSLAGPDPSLLADAERFIALVAGADDSADGFVSKLYAANIDELQVQWIPRIDEEGPQ